MAIIIVVAFALIFMLGALAIVKTGSDTLQCPKCGGDMFFIGNISEGKIHYDNEKHTGCSHLYKCSKCGYEKML